MTTHFQFNWVEDAAPSPDTPMNQTMAELSIQVDGETVTSVRDRTSNACRDHVVVPLLSMAQWLVDNWCHIWHEMPDRRSQKYGFAQRHTLAFTGDGFLFPKLTMTPSVDGKQKLQWTRWQPDHARIEFMTSGEANVDRDPLEAELKRVIEAVLERMKDLGYQQGSVVSDLEDSWQAIKNLDPEEHDFCRATALLGIDPFHVGEEKAEAIIKFWECTNPFIREDVLASLEEDSFLDASPWLEDIQTQFEHSYKGSGREWAAIRNSLPKMRLRKPWEQGYMLAKCLRHKLDCGDGSFDFASSRQPTLSFCPFNRQQKRLLIAWRDSSRPMNQPVPSCAKEISASDFFVPGLWVITWGDQKSDQVFLHPWTQHARHNPELLQQNFWPRMILCALGFLMTETQAMR